MPKLSDEEFERVFGIRIRKPLSPEEKIQANEINQLFDEMQFRFKVGSFRIFKELGVLDRHGTFLNDVRTCPEHALEYCRTQLAPKAIAA